MMEPIEDRQLSVPQSAFLAPQMCPSAFYQALVTHEIEVESVAAPQNDALLVTLRRAVQAGDAEAIQEIASEIGEADAPVTFTELMAVIDNKSAEITEQGELITDLTARLTTLEATIAALQAALAP